MTERDQLSKAATLHCSFYIAKILVALLTVWVAWSDAHKHASNVYFTYNSSYKAGLVFSRITVFHCDLSSIY